MLEREVLIFAFSVCAFETVKKNRVNNNVNKFFII
jgi:hypothetical protein